MSVGEGCLYSILGRDQSLARKHAAARDLKSLERLAVRELDCRAGFLCDEDVSFGRFRGRHI